MVSYIHVDSSATPTLAVDEVEQVQRQRIAGLIGHTFQLTYANMPDELIQEEKLNRCHGCAIQHPSQRRHSFVMMDKEDSWLYYREDVVENIDLNAVPNKVESVCHALGFKLGHSCEMYVSELPKMPWTSIFLTSLEVDGLDGDFQSRVSLAIREGPNGLKSKEFSDQQAEIECPEQVLRKDKEQMGINSVINDIQNNLCL